MNKMKKTAACLAVTLALSGVLPVQAAQAKRFSDVKEEDWFYSFVTQLSEQKVVSGYPDGSFQPQNNVTVGEALSLILLASGHEMKPATGTHWSSGLADYAVKNKYMPAALREDLDARMTRLDVAQLAAKALKLVPDRGESAFADTKDGYVNVLFRKKVLAGSMEGDQRVFKPNEPISRAEICAIVWNIRNTDVHAGQIGTEYYYVDVLPEVPVNPYNSSLFQMNGKYMDYLDPNVETKVGVDVASFQGDIDWEKVKADGIDFAIVRIGGRGLTVGSIYDDKKFQQNMEGALAAGLDVGAYFFSQAITVEEAREEAQYVLDKLAPYRHQITMPVVFDWEDMGNSGHRGYRLAPDILSAGANLFCGMMEREGYQPMIYFNRYGGYRSYDLSQMLDYQFWFAQYLSTTKFPTFYYDFDMWQYTSKGRVDGIQGDVDVNLYLMKQDGFPRPEPPKKPDEGEQKPSEGEQKPAEGTQIPDDGTIPPDGLGLPRPKQ